MLLKCPNCGDEISTDNVNISTDLAKCDSCKSILKASDLVSFIDPIKALKNKPKDSVIDVKLGFDDAVELFLPKKGFSLSIIPMMGFIALWISFISFWTFGAMQSSLIFALFSIPFWAIGIAMFVSALNSVFESQYLSINRKNLVLKKHRLINSKNYIFDIKDIDSIQLSQFSKRKYNNRNRNTYGNSVGIFGPAKTVYLFDKASEAEKIWLAESLGALIKKFKN